jgi:glutaredoxin
MTIELYSRPGCHLCEEARKVILNAAKQYTFNLIEHNVEQNPEWEREFGWDIPVIFIDGRKAFKHRVEPALLERYFVR